MEVNQLYCYVHVIIRSVRCNLYSVKGLTWPPHSLFLFSVDSRAPVESLLGGQDSFKLLYFFCAAASCMYQHGLSYNISLHLISNKIPFPFFGF